MFVAAQISRKNLGRHGAIVQRAAMVGTVDWTTQLTPERHLDSRLDQHSPVAH